MKFQTQNVKNRIKACVGRMIFNSAMHRLFLADTAVVVAFHRVNGAAAVGDSLTCSVEMFKKYCRFFDRYFQVVSLRRLVEKMENGLPLNRELAITFDDGYRDNYEYAAPVLKEVGLPATFFVVTQFINTDFVPWWDRGLTISHPWMTWDQVRGLHSAGFEIGAHGRTHADLGEISGEKAREEILGCRDELQEKLSAPVDLFAYPYGGENHITEENRKIVKTTGFRCCPSCFGGVNSTGTDPFYMRRVPISQWHASPHHFGCDVAFRRV